ncbi:hypothetical protein OAK47_00550 [Planctomycetaceae bacterium]|nr:hypothetical protein [Planctomycetaceae bacterium]MDG2389890.1 hypothetical protein [Planctomycetaceae bacterium]
MLPYDFLDPSLALSMLSLACSHKQGMATAKSQEAITPCLA